MDFIAIIFLCSEARVGNCNPRAKPHPAHVACELRMVFIFLKDLRKQRNKEECVVETVCGLESLKYLLSSSL